MAPELQLAVLLMIEEGLQVPLLSVVELVLPVPAPLSLWQVCVVVILAGL